MHGKRGGKEEGDGAARNRRIGKREAADKRRRVAIVNTSARHTAKERIGGERKKGGNDSWQNREGISEAKAEFCGMTPAYISSK